MLSSNYRQHVACYTSKQPLASTQKPLINRLDHNQQTGVSPFLRKKKPFLRLLHPPPENWTAHPSGSGPMLFIKVKFSTVSEKTHSSRFLRKRNESVLTGAGVRKAGPEPSAGSTWIDFGTKRSQQRKEFYSDAIIIEAVLPFPLHASPDTWVIWPGWPESNRHRCHLNPSFGSRPSPRQGGSEDFDLLLPKNIQVQIYF